MSGYILCQVKRAKLPYYIENISTNIYSIEELCFYFYHNIYLSLIHIWTLPTILRV